LRYEFTFPHIEHFSRNLWSIIIPGFLVFFLSKLSQRPGDFEAGTIVVRDRNITLKDLDKYLEMTDNDNQKTKFLQIRGLRDWQWRLGN